MISEILGAITALEQLTALVTKIAQNSKRQRAWTEEENLEFAQRINALRKKWSEMQDFVEGDDNPLTLM